MPGGGRHVFALLALVLLAFLAAPAVQGTPPWNVELTTDRVQTGPDSLSAGTLRFFVARPASEGEESIPASFRLQAAHLRVEVDHVGTRIRTGASFHGFGDETRNHTFGEVLVEGVENRPMYRLLVAPTEGAASARIVSDCAEISPSGKDAGSQPPLAAAPPRRSPVGPDVANALSWKDCGWGTDVVVTGDFLVALWEWDFQVHEDGGTQDFATGRRPHPLLGAVPGTSETASEDREAWLFIEDGSLRFTLGAGADHELFLGPNASVHTESWLRLESATGSVALAERERLVESAQVKVHGALDLDLRRAAGQTGLLAVLGGEPTQLSIDAGPAWVSLPVPAAVPRGYGAVAALAAGAVALLLFVAAPQAYHRSLRDAGARKVRGLPGRTWRERHASAFIVMGRNAYGRGRPRLALLLARLAIWFHDHPQAHVGRARAYHALGRTRRQEQAHRRIDSLLGRDAPQRCRNAWEAFTALHASDPDRAWAWHDHARACDARTFLSLASSHVVRRAPADPRRHRRAGTAGSTPLRRVAPVDG